MCDSDICIGKTKMICFAWSQFPQYAARCVGALVRATTEEISVVATRPRVPIMGMDALAGCRVVWIGEDDPRRIDEIVGEMPHVIFTSGWGVPLFNRFRDEVHAAGGKVIAMSDNNFQFSIKEILKAIRFRLKIRRHYDGYFVAGKSCAKLLRFYGVAANRIKIGVYAADSSVFNDGGVSILDRPKKIIFVGQLCDRKNPLRLCAAFRAVGAAEKGWSLDLYGCGPLKDRLPQGDGIAVHDFLQPVELAAKYRESRIFCLPSLEEHWGLVVHEAALSGCVLLLSDAIGSRDDFVGKKNGFVFPPADDSAFAAALHRVVSLQDFEFRAASAESMKLGRCISLEKFVEGAMSFA